jgi:hypothetical protein
MKRTEGHHDTIHVPLVVGFEEFIHISVPDGSMLLKCKENIMMLRFAGTQSPCLTLAFDQGDYVVVVGVTCFLSLLDDGGVVPPDMTGFGIFVVASRNVTVVDTHGGEPKSTFRRGPMPMFPRETMSMSSTYRSWGGGTDSCMTFQASSQPSIP